jgi:leucyl-tRNA synthetase
MAREKATKTWWNWSTAGKKTEDKKPIVTKVELKGEKVMTYHTKKGDFIWAKDVEPEYIWFNGKMRFKLSLPVDMPKAEIEKAAIAAEEAQKWLAGKTVRKIIVVPKRIINVVVG